MAPARSCDSETQLNSCLLFRRLPVTKEHAACLLGNTGVKMCPNPDPQNPSNLQKWARFRFSRISRNVRKRQGLGFDGFGFLRILLVGTPGFEPGVWSILDRRQCEARVSVALTVGRNFSATFSNPCRRPLAGGRI